MGIKIKLNTKEIFDISDFDKICLENALSDIEEWIVKAVEGKINNCKKRMVESCVEILREEGESIPVSDEELITGFVTRPDYKNRKKRDEEEEEEEAERLARLGEEEEEPE